MRNKGGNARLLGIKEAFSSQKGILAPILEPGGIHFLSARLYKLWIQSGFFHIVTVVNEYV